MARPNLIDQDSSNKRPSALFVGCMSCLPIDRQDSNVSDSLADHAPRVVPEV